MCLMWKLYYLPVLGLVSCINVQGEFLPYFEPPRLNVNGPYLDINKSTTLELQCSGRYPVFWKLPDTVNIEERGTLLQYNSSSKCTTRISINNVSYTDTGNYTCYYEGTTDFEFWDNITSVYTFVNDPDNLFLRKSKVQDHVLILVRRSRKVTIGCLPTYSRANVSLWKVDNNIEEEVTLENYVSFDPRQGFILLYPTVYFTGSFQCRANVDNYNQTIKLTLVFWGETITIPDPTIDITEADRPVLHQNFTLKCTVVVDLQTRVNFYWTFPNHGKNDSRVHLTLKEQPKNIRMFTYKQISSFLHVDDAQFSDTGTYNCSVTDHDEKTGSTAVNLRVYESRQPSHVNFSSDWNFSKPVTFEAGKNIQIVISVQRYPSRAKVQLHWLKDGREYPSDVQTQLMTRGDSVKLELKHLSRSDAGIYTLVGRTADTANNISFTLDVEAPPVIEITNTLSHYMLGMNYTLVCTANSVPTPVVWWRWKQCEKITECKPNAVHLFKDIEKDQNFQNQDDVEYRSGDIRNHSSIAVLHVTASMSGMYGCMASNIKGEDNVVVPFVVSDVNNGFDAFSSINQPIERDVVTLTCKANLFEFNHVKWLLPARGSPATNESSYTITTLNTKYSAASWIKFHSIEQRHKGTYVCEASRHSENDTAVLKSVTLEVKSIQKPIFKASNMGKITTTSSGYGLALNCYVQGVPVPTVSWYKGDKEPTRIWNTSGIELVDNNQKLILKAKTEYVGFYECRAVNRGGEIRANTTILHDSGDIHTDGGWVITASLVIVIVFLMVLIIFLAILRCRRNDKLKKDLETLHDSFFGGNYLGSLNLNLPIQDQPDLIPYNSQWEFPKERIKLGRTIGQGAFGRVVKAKAIGLSENEVSTTVAVKMLKDSANKEQRMALMTELKVLIYLGKHVNIVNLLGAFTKNLLKGELMVMVEYCYYGNLRHYLLKYKKSYINQLDPVTGAIVPLVPTRSNSPMVEYANGMNFAVDNPSYQGQFLHYADLSHEERVPEMEASELSIPLNNRYFPSPRRCSDSDDYNDEEIVISTSTLLCFAFQCARGMEYLASKKLIHRDLAARNILIAKDNIVKICDFGLAKNCYNYGRSNYVKKTNGLMPVKWMAIESIWDKVFTTESDVWSFGILLWEMFTFGGDPYPGMEINDDFFKKLKNGYRLEKPELCPQTIYDDMMLCWQNDPNLRPNFAELGEKIGGLLETSVRKYYIDLNTPYQLINNKFFNNNDYLEMTDKKSAEDYIKMTNNETVIIPNSYDNFIATMPFSSDFIPNVPTNSFPMIPLQNLQDFKKPILRRSVSLELISKDDFNVNNAMEGSKSDDDDSVFLDEHIFARQHHQYVNGFCRVMHGSEMSTRC